MSQILRTSIYCEKLFCTADVEIEWEYVANPNGRPDPKDPWSEGYDIEPEIISVNVLEFDADLPGGDWVDIYINDFEKIHYDDLKEILDGYVSEKEDDFDYYEPEEDE
jgi:hypothetical protein